LCLQRRQTKDQQPYEAHLETQTHAEAECYALPFFTCYPVFRSHPSEHMPLTREKCQLMSASEIDRTLVRLAHEILEKTRDLDQLAFIGIRRRGVPLAQRLSAKIAALENRTVPVGILDINLIQVFG